MPGLQFYQSPFCTKFPVIQEKNVPLYQHSCLQFCLYVPISFYELFSLMISLTVMSCFNLNKHTLIHIFLISLKTCLDLFLIKVNPEILSKCVKFVILTKYKNVYILFYLSFQINSHGKVLDIQNYCRIVFICRNLVPDFFFFCNRKSY